MLGCPLGNDPADMSRPCKIDAPDFRCVDQCADNFGSVFRRIGNNIDDAFRETRRYKSFNNQLVRARAYLACLKDNTVPAGKRYCNSTDTQNNRRVPWCNAKDDTHRLFQCHRHAPRLVGWDDFTSNLSGKCGRFTQQGNGESDVEHCPTGGSADLVHHGIDKRILARVEFFGCLRQQSPARIRARCGPVRERRCSPCRDRGNIRSRHGGGGGCRRAG